MKKILLLSATLMISVLVSAQGLDFTGTWKLNTSKSKLGDQFSMAPREIIITQKDNDLAVEKQSSFQDQEFTTTDKFTLDGKECVNTGWQDSQKKSTVAWADDKQSLKITSKLNIGDGGEMTIVEVLKKDGPNMVIESSSSSSFGDMSETMVYEKQ